MEEKTGDFPESAMPGYVKQILKHYENIWRVEGKPKYWYKGPLNRLDPDFYVLEFSPAPGRTMWTYATCGMSSQTDDNRLELHLFSSTQDETLVELLTIVAAYHRNDVKLSLHHTIFFGRPWQEKSKCEYGLISLPYLDGPPLESGEIAGSTVKFYWLIPVTKDELEFKKKRGISALEDRFEVIGVNYIDPLRPSAV
jgi:hypothetical protein